MDDTRAHRCAVFAVEPSLLKAARTMRQDEYVGIADDCPQGVRICRGIEVKLGRAFPRRSQRRGWGIDGVYQEMEVLPILTEVVPNVCRGRFVVGNSDRLWAISVMVSQRRYVITSTHI